MKHATDFWSNFPEAAVDGTYVHESRPLGAIRKLLIDGAIDVYFFRADVPQLVVSGVSQEAVDAVSSRINGDKLVVGCEVSSIFIGGAGVQISNAPGSIHIGYVGGNVRISGGGRSVHFSGNQVAFEGVAGRNFRAVVGIALPYLMAVKIKGTGAAVLRGLKQQLIELEVQGTGDVVVSGEVARLVAGIRGTGDIDARALVSQTADLSVGGTGSISANVSQEVAARVSGVGDIVVRGNPSIRSKSVSGLGSIKFK